MLSYVVLAGLSADERRRWQAMFASSDLILKSVKGKTNLAAKIEPHTCDVVVIPRSILLAGSEDLVASIRRLPDQPDIVVLTERENAEDRAKWLTKGCFASLNQGLPDMAVQQTIKALLERRRSARIRQTEQTLRSSQLHNFASASPTMRQFLQTVQRVVSADTSLLLMGETGVGKEHLASAIHAEGPRRIEPFIAVNCGALPEQLLESELFGHEEGAFTGATRARRGHFELAHQGTIFLDEIGELPLHLQVKLLRVLQEHTIQRVGGERPISLDVRVIAATNRDLLAEIEEKRFRQDLYYRLAVVTLTLPPLRERPEDIPLLVESYLTHFRRRLGRDVRGITSDALSALESYHWPGNVRELINVVERAVLLCPGKTLGLSDLPPAITATQSIRTSFVTSEPSMQEWSHKAWKQARREIVDSFERTYLEKLLLQSSGSISKTAKQAGITPRSLFEKMQKHGLNKMDYRRQT